MHPLTRRDLLHAAGAAALASLCPRPTPAAEDKKAEYTLPPLPYDYDALEPYIDKLTMQIHHDRHHKAYVDNLNKFLVKQPDLYGKPIGEVLRDVQKLNKDIRQPVINNGGGHLNHTMFWELMGPKAGKPDDALSKALDDTFGGLAAFQKKFKEAALARFGSGWAWLVVDNGKLAIVSTANQDNPIMQGKTPILGLDVWEHAYYLKYQNKRPDYVDAWWNVVHWQQVSKLHAGATREG